MTEFEYWVMGVCISMTIMLVVIFCIIHSHVWTKNGYAGLNGKLEDHEVDKFINHVLSEASLVILFVFCMLDPLLVFHLHYQYSVETKIIFGSTFVGSGLYTILGQRLKDAKTKHIHESKNENN